MHQTKGHVAAIPSSSQGRVSFSAFSLSLTRARLELGFAVRVRVRVRVRWSGLGPIVDARDRDR